MPKVTRPTIKERIFAAEYVKGRNGTKAALKAYDTTDEKTASVISAENLAKPRVKKLVDEALVKLHLTPEYTLNGFKTLHESHFSENPNASVRALENIADIMNLYPSQKSLSMSDGDIKSISWQE